MSDVTPKTESGRAYLAKLGPETGIGSHNIRRDAILAIEQEAASKAVAEAVRFATWIDQNVPVGFGDWACVDCRPQSDMIVDGFRCVVHEARALIASERGT